MLIYPCLIQLPDLAQVSDDPSRELENILHILRNIYEPHLGTFKKERDLLCLQLSNLKSHLDPDQAIRPKLPLRCQKRPPAWHSLVNERFHYLASIDSRFAQRLTLKQIEAMLLNARSNRRKLDLFQVCAVFRLLSFDLGRICIGVSHMQTNVIARQALCLKTIDDLLDSTGTHFSYLKLTLPSDFARDLAWRS